MKYRKFLLPLFALLVVQETSAQTKPDGRYYRLFAPTTFYHSGANKSLSLNPTMGDEVTDAVDEALMHIYLNRPDLVQNTESQLQKTGSVREDVNQEVKQDVELVDQTLPAPDEPEALPVGIVVTKPNFWKFKGDGFLQFLQNYVTSNWHKGGESNYSAVGAVTLELNYNDKDKFTFENKLEMKLGFQTSRTDSVHKFKTNNDILRLTSKLGVQASNKWYYSLQLLAYTQFAKGLKANDEFVYSDFFSPFDLNIGLGMEYKLNALDGKLTGTLNFLPLAYNLRYVGRTTLFDRNGMEGKHTKHEFGAQFTGDVKWQIVDHVSWKSRLYAYTSYKRALVEWENQIEFKVTKYISANLFLYPRFDDAATRDSDNGYWQFMEYSSLGLSYTF
ncbi:MAG: DUF3078 domain-containing protein [Prevotella sp.]|nr:DUF3078 domain-containing protein [Prevotella sp.]